MLITNYKPSKAKLDFVSFLPLILGLMGIGYAIIGLATSYPMIMLGLAIAGLGLGFLMPNMSVWISAAVPDARRGRALGGLSTALFLGQFLSPIFSQFISQQVGLGLTYAIAGTVLLLLGVAFMLAKPRVTAFTAIASEAAK